MKIAIFGATGKIGRHVVQHALDRGYEVHAYVRSPQKMDTTHPGLTVFTGQLNDYEGIRKAIIGCNAVVNVLAVPTKFSYEGMASLEGHENFIKAMRELNVSRLVDWSTPTIASAADTRTFILKFTSAVARTVWRKGNKELTAVAEAVRSSGLDWTLVRFLFPNDNPAAEVKAGFGDTKMSYRISRSSIGAFMVDQVESAEYSGLMPIIGS